VNAQVAGEKPRRRQAASRRRQSRARRQAGGDKARRTARTKQHRRRAVNSHESFSDVHCPARRHFAADGRAFCWWAAWPTSNCRCRRCRKWIIPPSRSSRSTRAPVPDVMASSVTAPLERQFGEVPGLQQMTSTSSDGSSVITLEFNLSLNIDVAEQEVQQSINASGTYLAGGPAGAAHLRQGESRRYAHPDAGADCPTRFALEGGGSGRHAAGAQDFATAGRGSGEHQRRPEARGAHSGQSHGAGVVRPEPGRPAQCHHRRERQSGQGQFRRRASGVSDRRQRSDCFRAPTTRR
jgi:hypothetical protein